MKIEQTFNIADFARIKNCTRQTVYSNIRSFDVDARKRIIWNAKSQKWQPNKKMIPKGFRKT